MIRTSLILILLTSASAPGADALTRRQKGDLAIEARSILRKYCGDCHGLDPAPSTLSLLNHGQLVDNPAAPVPWVSRTDGVRSQIIELIEDGSMPPGGRMRPTDAEIDTLKKWITNRAPSYPRAFDDATTLALMLDDLDRQNPMQDIAKFRYISFAHLLRDDAELPKLADVEIRLQKAILASSGRSIAPEPVDDTATLFRIDISKLDWDMPDLFEQIENQKPTGKYPIVPYDLIVNEYPASLVGAVPDDLQKRLDDYLKTAKQLRPVPYLRGDWLADALAPASPLATDMKSLVALAESEDRKTPTPCGPTPRPFTGAKNVDEGGSAPPLSSWYGGSTPPASDPFGVKAHIFLPEKGPPSAKVTAIDTDDKYRIRVEGKREFRFTLLEVLAWGDVRVQRVAGGNILKPSEPKLFGPDSSVTFVGGKQTNDNEETIYYVLIASDATAPPPTIVRSIHADRLECREKNHQPVWRFLYDKPTKDFDPSKAVRVVLPLTIRKKS